MLYLLYLTNALLFFIIGYNYHSYRQRGRVSRPKEIPKKVLTDILKGEHNNSQAVNIISPSKRDEREQVIKTLTSS